MKKYSILIILSIFSLKLYAEKIDGPANVRLSVNGEKVISLFDNSNVSCTKLVNNWYTIGINIKITKEQYENDIIVLPPRTTLYNLDNELIGETIKELVFSEKMSGMWAGVEWHGVTFIGYTYKSNIKLTSIPEIKLNQIITENKTEYNLLDFKNFFKLYDFEIGGLLSRKEYTEYIIYENWIEDLSPMDRLRLTFKNSKLISIIHTRKLNLDFIKSIQLIENLKIKIFDKMDDEQKRNYIKLNIDSYNGVD